MKRLDDIALDVFWTVLCMLFVYVCVYGRAFLLTILQFPDVPHAISAPAPLDLGGRPAGQD